MAVHLLLTKMQERALLLCNSFAIDPLRRNSAAQFKGIHRRGGGGISRDQLVRWHDGHVLAYLLHAGRINSRPQSTHVSAQVNLESHRFTIHFDHDAIMVRRLSPRVRDGCNNLVSRLEGKGLGAHDAESRDTDAIQIGNKYTSAEHVGGDSGFFFKVPVPVPRYTGAGTGTGAGAGTGAGLPVPVRYRCRYRSVV